MTYPTQVEINGELYPINTDYRDALRCFEVINDTDISDYERAYAIVYILFGDIPEDELMDEFVKMAVKFLQCGETRQEQNSKPANMDFEYDRSYIAASFMSDYHVDLSKVDMHWWQYVDLISGLTEHSVLSRIRYIRDYDLSTIKDARERAKMAEAKKAVALPERLTKEEKEALDRFEALFT